MRLEQVEYQPVALGVVALRGAEQEYLRVPGRSREPHRECALDAVVAEVVSVDLEPKQLSARQEVRELVSGEVAGAVLIGADRELVSQPPERFLDARRRRLVYLAPARAGLVKDGPLAGAVKLRVADAVARDELAEPVEEFGRNAVGPSTASPSRRKSSTARRSDCASAGTTAPRYDDLRIDTIAATPQGATDPRTGPINRAATNDLDGSCEPMPSGGTVVAL